jgi:hypothetical protein
MKDESHPKYMWHVSISEKDGRWIKLYVSRDTSSVRSQLASLTHNTLLMSRLDQSSLGC